MYLDIGKCRSALITERVFGFHMNVKTDLLLLVDAAFRTDPMFLGVTDMIMPGFCRDKTAIDNSRTTLLHGNVPADNAEAVLVLSQILVHRKNNRGIDPRRLRS